MSTPAVDTAARTAYALDIGGTKTAAALVEVTADGANARVLRQCTAPTPARSGAAAILAGALELLEGLEVPAGAAPPQAVGIASAGVIAPGRGAVTHATDSLSGWAGTDVAAAVGRGTGLPVSVLNDVHSHGLGEARFGVGRETASLLLVAVGTGVGGCVVIDGEPQLGGRGAAGHVGHVSVPEADGVACSCGRTGHLEGLASGPGILALAGRRGVRGPDGAPPADGRALAALARAGDADAREVHRTAGWAIGRVIGGLLNVLDPDVVAVTGGVTALGDPWWDALRAGLAHDAMDVVAQTPVLPAAAGNDAALLGAAVHALDHLPR